MAIRRRTAGERTDDLEYEFHRRRQTPADRAEERLDIIEHETLARVGKHEWQQRQPYAGSELEREHRSHG